MIIASYVSLFVFGLLDNFRGPFFSAQLHDFGLSESAGAALFGVTSLLASLSSLLGSRLMGRLQPQGLLNFSSLLMAIGFLTMSVAPLFFVMILGAALFGSGLGFATIAQNFSVAEFSSQKRRSQNLSGLHAMYGLSSMIAPLIAHEAMMLGLSWRLSYGLVAIGPLLLFVGGICWAKRRRPEAKITESQPAPLRLSRNARWHAFTLGLFMALYLLSEISLGTRMVRWLEVKFHTAPETGSLYLTGFFAMLLLGRLITWVWSPHHLKSLRRSLVFCLLIALVFLTVGWLYDPIWAVLCGLPLGPFYPLAVSYTRVRLHKEVAPALSLIMAMGSATVVMMHFSIGSMADHFGLQMAMGVGPVGLGLALLILGFEFRKQWRTVGETNSLNGNS